MIDQLVKHMTVIQDMTFAEKQHSETLTLEETIDQRLERTRRLVQKLQKTQLCTCAGVVVAIVAIMLWAVATGSPSSSTFPILCMLIPTTLLMTTLLCQSMQGWLTRDEVLVAVWKALRTPEEPVTELSDATQSE